MIDITCSCGDFKYCQYMYKDLQKCVVEIGGMDIYNEIHITNEIVWLDHESNEGHLHH